MTDQPPSNPFQPQQPISSPELFFGRDGAVAFIRERLVTGNNPRAIALLGSHRIGKTSLLFQLPSRLEPRYVFAYIDLAVIDYEEPSALIFAMIDAVRQALEVAGISTYRLPPLPETLDNLWGWFTETYLEVVLSALRKLRRLLFLFDNTSALLDVIDRREMPAEIGARLTALMVAESRLDLIFAVDVVDEYRLEQFLPLSDPMLHRRLGMLDEAAALALTRQPVTDTYQLEEDTAVGVYSVTGGHPYLLQVVNYLLWEHSAARDHQGLVTLHDLQTVIPQAVQITDPTLKQVWDDCTPNERAILTALTDLIDQSDGQPIRPEAIRTWLLRETNEALDETAISSTLRRLEYREVVRTVDDGETFAAGLQYQWLRRQLGVEEALPAPLPTSRPPLRRLAIPLLLLIATAVMAALLLGRVLSTGATTPTAAAGTVTFAVNVHETQQALDLTQTFIALPTNTPTATLTYTASATATFTYTSTTTSTATQTVSSTPTQTETAVPTTTATAEITSIASLSATEVPTEIAVTPTVEITPMQPAPTVLPVLSTAEPPTVTPSVSDTPSTTSTATPLPTDTAMPTLTSTITSTTTTTPTYSFTPTSTSTTTFTPTPTVTSTSTFTQTPTPTSTRTSTATRTAFPTNTRRPSITPPPFPTAQIVATGRP